MPTVTFDSRSFMLDGRRIWIVGGTISYAHLPRAEWADRLHAAKLAGLNTVQVPVLWARHEPLAGQFDFADDADLRAFVEMAHDAGLYVILRLGPAQGQDHDFGGLPTWLTQLPAHELRSNSGAFLEACSRYITAVADQVRDLQINAAGKGGPILLIQNEHLWTCGAQDLAQSYLGELYRYIREAGLSVPVINANNLWASVEGEVDCWVGNEDLLATLRQLSEVRPDHPRLVLDLATSEPPTWGGKPEPQDGRDLLRLLVEIISGAGQFTLSRFAPGTNLGFSGGKLGGYAEAFAATDRGGLVDASGQSTDALKMARRACMFASAFGRTLAHLHPESRPIVVHPGDAPREGKGYLSIVQLGGSFGGVACVFELGSANRGKTSRTLLLADGTPVPLTIGEQGVAWLLHGVNLTSKHTLDYTNLNVLTISGTTLVCFGPAATEGIVCINGSPLSVTVPRGKSPQAVEHEGMLVVVCSEAQVDECFVADGMVYAGVAGVRADGSPIALPDSKTCQVVDSDGTLRTHPVDAPPKTPKRVALEWSECSTQDYAEGESAKYASIDGPADLATLGAASGYGWYRLSGKIPAGSGALSFPEAADRLQVFVGGESSAVLGAGPGAQPAIKARGLKGEATIVVLAENLGRAASGILFGERKGVFGDGFELAPVELQGPEVETHPPTDLLAFRTPMWLVHQNDHTSPHRYVWSFTHRRKSPLFLSVSEGLGRGLLILNDVPIACFDDAGFSGLRLETDELKRGVNVLHLAMHDDGLSGAPDAEAAGERLADIAKAVRIDEGRADLTGKLDWAFAKWERPAPAAYEPVAKAQLKARNWPTWWRASFQAADTQAPLELDLTGMTKGQAYVNGNHLGRYFVQAPGNKAPLSDGRLRVPESWLEPGKHNEVVLFDEHGAAPSRVRLAYSAGSAVLRV
ncbi:MAG: beta-galactosidase [Planctomycetota bacterium]